MAIVYRPSAASVQRDAISACPPESGLMYQLSTGGPLSPLPQAARPEAATTALAAIPTSRALDRPVCFVALGTPPPMVGRPGGRGRPGDP
ncbi:hypothetical protein GCM10011381_40960 [Klenkia taihuensis]|nr:hypothetical protein GCM10011381_40960 [Klenkia taihuensis]